MALASVSAVLAACNAIVGVEDVRLATLGGSREDGGDPDPGDADPNLPPIDGDKPAVDIGTLALGFLHACARMPNGTVRCWGDNGAGQLGDGIPFDGPRDEAVVPQNVPGIKDAVGIAAGLSHTCVIHKGGAVSCWGINSFGQLGDGTKQRSSSPVDVTGLTDAIELAGGTSFMCALRKDHSVSCWGANYSGQLGDGTTTDRGSPASVKGVSKAVTIAAAEHHACAVHDDGTVSCWGRSDDGQIGNGVVTKAADPPVPPTKLGGLSDIVQVAAAARFACARQKGGRVFCWGNNQFGQLGNGNANTTPNPSPIIVPSLGDAIFIWTGYEHACAVRKSGAVACWGSAEEGQLGFGSPSTDASIASPVAVIGVTNVQFVWTGGNRSCALRSDGKAFCWGQNTLGQLGNGTKDPAYGATPVSGF